MTMPAFLFRIKHNTPPSLRMNPMPVSHRRILTSTRLSRQCRPNACDFFHVKTVTTKPHCHDTDLPRSSELQSYAYAILPPPQPSVMAVPLYYISLITDATQYIINKETNVSTLLQLKIQKSNKHNVKNKKSDRANAQPQKIIMIKQCRQMQWAQVLNLSGTARFLVKSLLWKADSLRRTNISTCAALSAHVRIDRILFSLWDCANRALVNTCTACDTIVTNYVSHS